MKVIITESQYNRVIDQFITYLLEPHEVMTSEDYPDSIFWFRGDKFLARIKNSEIFFLDLKNWERIEVMFDLDYDDTQSAIKTWLEQHYNLGELTPRLQMINLLF